MRTLDELPVGMTAVITNISGKRDSLRRHLLEMGLTPKTEVTLVKTAPLGDPLELKVRGYELTLRKKDAKNISIENVHKASSCPLDLHILKKAVLTRKGEKTELNLKSCGEVIPEDAPIRFGLLASVPANSSMSPTLRQDTSGIPALIDTSTVVSLPDW